MGGWVGGEEWNAGGGAPARPGCSERTQVAACHGAQALLEQEGCPAPCARGVSHARTAPGRGLRGGGVWNT